VLRRLKTDCLDLPEKLPAVALTATLMPETWELYRDMRDEFVVWLDSQTLSTAPQAGIKALRLSQLVNGFIGGVRNDRLDEEVESTREVGREKLDVFLDWLAVRYEVEPELKLLVWCRFRAELARIILELGRKFPHVKLGKIWGGQSPDERELALRLLNPDTAPAGEPVIVVGTPSSGALGINLSAAHDVIYLSNDYSLKTRLQSEDRVHRPGQVCPVSYFDVVAVGPQGQRTIDSVILRALRTKNDVATWTTSAWRDAIREE
jgi:SNF2 family DNA or RNA helicase